MNDDQKLKVFRNQCAESLFDISQEFMDYSHATISNDDLKDRIDRILGNLFEVEKKLFPEDFIIED